MISECSTEIIQDLAQLYGKDRLIGTVQEIIIWQYDQMVNPQSGLEN